MKVDLRQTIWVIKQAYFSFAPVKLLHATLFQRGIEVFNYDDTNLEDLKKMLLKSDKHVVFHLPLDRQLHSLKETLQARHNFSALYSDWWTDANDPFIEEADFLIFHHYNIIRAIGEGRALSAKNVPLFSPSQRKTLHETMLSYARIPYVAFIPFVDMIKWFQRKIYPYRKKKLIYMPFAIDPSQFKDLPESKPEYDFISAGAVSFFSIIRNCYAPASFSFINLYRDRLKLIDTMLSYPKLKIFDDRRIKVRGRQTLEAIKNSKFAISTGGLHQASVLKYLEIIGCGTPIIGSGVAGEFPLLKYTLFEIDVFGSTDEEIKQQLYEALSKYSRYKQAADVAQKHIFTHYTQNALLDLLQSQYKGNSISKNYLQP